MENVLRVSVSTRSECGIDSRIYFIELFLLTCFLETAKALSSVNFSY